jgi:adenylate kinase family enzyme
VAEEVLIERCNARANASAVKREDDNMETLLKRFKAFKEQSRPVVDLYMKFGKVHYIEALGSIDDVYAHTRRAMLP